MNNSNNRPLGWTTLEEAKKLIEAGLDKNTADMWISPKGIYIGRKETPIKYETFPCWSLGALLELIPKIYESENDGWCYPTLCKRYDTDKWHCLYCRDTLYKTRQYDTAIEACVEMIIWILKTNYYDRQDI